MADIHYKVPALCSIVALANGNNMILNVELIWPTR
jgi:hypothetical protein